MFRFLDTLFILYLWRGMKWGHHLNLMVAKNVGGGTRMRSNPGDQDTRATPVHEGLEK